MSRRLTIAIPTYNRAALLDSCLEQVCRQLRGHERDVEVMVFDNCSTDDTENVVRRRQVAHPSIRYHRNDRNIGSYWNIDQCYRKGDGEYVLVLGDDDLLLQGSLDAILRTVKTGPYGVIFLDGYGFDQDHLREAPLRQRVQRPRAYEDRTAFARRVSYFVTFVSGNVVNRSLVDPGLPSEEFAETNIGQVAWVLSAMLAAPMNAVIDGDVVAARNNKGSNYAVCEVFGKNLNRIFLHFRDIPGGAACIRAINGSLLLRFLPGLLFGIRTGRFAFEREDAYGVLVKVFRRNPSFWLFTAPVLLLPLPFASAWLFGTRIVRRASDAIRKMRDRSQEIDGNRTTTRSPIV